MRWSTANLRPTVFQFSFARGWKHAKPPCTLFYPHIRPVRPFEKIEDRWALTPEPEQSWQEPELPLPTLLEKCPNLKPIHRACITLRFVHGMSREEIASQTGLNEFQVKGHLQFALKLLRETMVSNRIPLASPGEVSADV